MDLTKSYEFFRPEDVNGRIHIIGCGSVGSTLAENLARCGITKMTLYDFDTVESRNIVNQMFTQKHIGMSKVDAVKDILCEINPQCEKDIVLKPEGWKGEILSGYVFLCPDSIEVRRDFVEKHIPSRFVKSVFDIRTMLEGAQHYAADWADEKAKARLLSTMQFSHEEASAETPTTACGVTLGVCQTVRIICGFATQNFIHLVKGEGYKWNIQYNFEKGTLFLDEFDG